MTVGIGDTRDSKWPYAGTVGQLKELGVNHIENSIGEVTTDPKNLLVTAPAYMYEGQPHEVFDSVGLMINDLSRMMEGQGQQK